MNYIIILIGLPGCGKTKFIENFTGITVDPFKCYDDWNIDFTNNYHNDLMKDNRRDFFTKDLMSENIIISSVDFCDENYLKRFIEEILKINKNININKIYFEKNVFKLIKNVILRDVEKGGYFKYIEGKGYWYFGRHRDNIPILKKEIENIKKMYDIYNIPKDSIKIKLKEKKGDIPYQFLSFL